jgi:MFS family permease
MAPHGRLRTAFLVSSVGDWIYRLAVPLLVLRLTGSAISTALAYALELMPYIVLGPVAGALADRFDRRRLLIGCDLVSAALAAGLAVLSATDRPSIPALYALALALACVRPYYFPAFQGLIKDRVDGPRLAGTNAWLQSVDSVLAFAGPIIGVATVTALGVPVAAAVNAASFLASALLVASMPPSAARAGSAGRTTLRLLAADVRTGFRALGADRVILAGTLLMAGMNLAVLLVESNLVYVVVDATGGSATVVGLVLGAQGLGALAGAVLAPRLIERYPSGRLVVLGMAAAAPALAAPAVAARAEVLVPSWFLLGLATSVIVVPWFTLRQHRVPSAVLGRVVSVGRAVSYATIPPAAVAGGLLVSGRSVVPLFLAAALLQVAVAAGTLLSPVWRAEPAPAEPAPVL